MKRLTEFDNINEIRYQLLDTLKDFPKGINSSLFIKEYFKKYPLSESNFYVKETNLKSLLKNLVLLGKVEIKDELFIPKKKIKHEKIDSTCFSKEIFNIIKEYKKPININIIYDILHKKDNSITKASINTTVLRLRKNQTILPINNSKPYFYIINEENNYLTFSERKEKIKELFDEKEVKDLLKSKKTKKEIAKDLNISEFHITRWCKENKVNRCFVRNSSVTIVELNKTFKSISECAKFLHVSKQFISSYIKKNKKIKNYTIIIN